MFVYRLSRIYLLTAMLLMLVSVAARCEHRPDEVLIKYKPGRGHQASIKAAAMSAQVIQSMDQIRYQRVKIPKGMTVEQAVAKFKQDPNVEYAGPNHVIRVCRTPNDDIFVNGLYIYFEIEGIVLFDETYYQWWLESGLSGIDAPQAWDIHTGEGSNIIIAILDSGVRSDHEALAAKIIPGINTIPGMSPSNTEDDFGHGTEVAGVAAAMTNNSIGVAGVCWGAKIMPVKIIQVDEWGYGASGSDADAAAGIIWAADHGANILNMSFGDLLANRAPGDTILEDAVNYAWSKGCLLVGGSGNDGVEQPFYPACFDNVLAVGATNEYGERATALDWGGGGSNYGDWLDVVAPGTNMVSTVHEDYGLGVGLYYGGLSGTSFSTPVVSGVAALLWSRNPTWTNQQVSRQIQLTCKDIGSPGWDPYTGYGLVSAYRALTLTPDTGKTIGQLSSIASGNSVWVSNAVITSGSSDLPDRMYIEQPDRACGTMLQFTTKPLGIVEGDVVDLFGTVMTVNGERSLQGVTLTKVSSVAPLRPVGISTKWVGGTRLALKSGITNGKGTNNVGLLTTVCGKVTAVGWTYFYIDDGAGVRDGSGMRGLKIMTRTLNKPAEGDFVRVTGISGIEQPPDAGVSIPVVRVRRQSDIRVLN